VEADAGDDGGEPRGTGTVLSRRGGRTADEREERRKKKEEKILNLNVADILKLLDIN